MKALRYLAAVIVAAMLTTVTVMAAPIDFVPSVEKNEVGFPTDKKDEDGNNIVGVITDSEGKEIEKINDLEMKITQIGDKSEGNEEIQNKLDNAKNQLQKTPVDNIIPNFEKLWKDTTDGAPVENAAVSYIFDVSLNANIPEGAEISFTIKNPGIDPDTYMMVIHNYEDDKWENVKFTRNSKGDITITTNSLSPFAIIVDNENAPSASANSPRSPKTGLENTAWLVAVAAVVLGSTGVVVYRKNNA